MKHEVQSFIGNIAMIACLDIFLLNNVLRNNRELIMDDKRNEWKQGSG